MKRFLLVCAVMILSASVAMAQHHRGTQQGTGQGQGAGASQGQNQGQAFDALLGQLSLTDKQQAEVDKLREKMTAALSKSSNNQAAAQQAQQEFRTKVLALLTPEQKKKLEELKAQHRSQTAHSGQGKQGGGQTQ